MHLFFYRSWSKRPKPAERSQGRWKELRPLQTRPPFSKSFRLWQARRTRTRRTRKLLTTLRSLWTPLRRECLWPRPWCMDWWRPPPMWSPAPEFQASKPLLPLPPDNPPKSLSLNSPPGSGSSPLSIGLLLLPLQSPLEEGVACRRWSTQDPTLTGTPPQPSSRSASSC